MYPFNGKSDELAPMNALGMFAEFHYVMVYFTARGFMGG